MTHLQLIEVSHLIISAHAPASLTPLWALFWVMNASNNWIPASSVAQFHYDYGFIERMKNSEDPDQLASDEAIWSRATPFSKHGLKFWKC